TLDAVRPTGPAGVCAVISETPAGCSRNERLSASAPVAVSAAPDSSEMTRTILVPTFYVPGQPSRAVRPSFDRNARAVRLFLEEVPLAHTFGLSEVNLSEWLTRGL